MGIYRHIGLIVNNGCDDIGSFAAYAGKLYKIIYIIGHFAIKIFYQHFGHAHEVAGFIVGKADTFDELVYIIKVCFGEAFRIGKMFEQVGGYNVHPLVGTLCGEYHRYQ